MSLRADLDAMASDLLKAASTETNIQVRLEIFKQVAAWAARADAGKKKQPADDATAGNVTSFADIRAKAKGGL